MSNNDNIRLLAIDEEQIRKYPLEIGRNHIIIHTYNRIVNSSTESPRMVIFMLIRELVDDTKPIETPKSNDNNYA